MLNNVPSLTSDNDPVEAAVAEYLAHLDRGETVDVPQLIAAHPGCELGLRQFLQQEQRLHVLTTGPLGHDSHAGQTLGDFRILGELGRGGMGVVYEAEQLSLGRRVALKVLPFAAMLDKQQLARFKNEARAAATLDHPHIVAIHAVGSEGNAHYYAMQLIGGSSLAEVIAAFRRAHRPPESGPASAGPAARSTDNRALSTAASHGVALPRPALREPSAPTPDRPLPLPAYGTSA